MTSYIVYARNAFARDAPSNPNPIMPTVRVIESLLLLTLRICIHADNQMLLSYD